MALFFLLFVLESCISVPAAILIIVATSTRLFFSLSEEISEEFPSVLFERPTQVKCSVCAVRGELGAGEDTAAGSATAAVAATVAAEAEAAARPRTPGDKHKRATAAAAAAAAAAASTRLPPPGKAWRRPGFPVDRLATATSAGTGKGRRWVPRVKGGGGGDGEAGGGAEPNGRIPREGGDGRRPKPAGPGPECCVGVVEGGSHPCACASASGAQEEEEEEERQHPEHSSSSSSSSSSLSSSTSGVLVHRGLKAGDGTLEAPLRRRRRRRLLEMSPSPSGSSALPCPGPVVGAVESGIGQDVPLAVVAARVQQQRCVDVPSIFHAAKHMHVSIHPPIDASTQSVVSQPMAVCLRRVTGGSSTDHPLLCSAKAPGIQGLGVYGTMKGRPTLEQNSKDLRHLASPQKKEFQLS